MAQHINYGQHIRKQPEQHIRQQTTMVDKFNDFIAKYTPQHIRSSPKGEIAGWVWVLLAIFIVIVFAIAGHYMRYWTIPKVSFIPQKPAPASHLQYFFF